MPEKPRMRGHALTWVAITRAGCECGKQFEIPADEAKDRSDKTIKDWLLDEHSLHLIAVSRK